MIHDRGLTDQHYAHVLYKDLVQVCNSSKKRRRGGGRRRKGEKKILDDQIRQSSMANFMTTV
jgi:hypothetical protein